MAELDRLYVRVLGDVTDLRKKLSKAEKHVEQFAYDMTRAGRTLTVGLTVPLLGMGAAAGKAASDFETSFAGIRKTMDLTEAEFGRLAQANRDLAKTIPVSVNELNRIGELAGQLGIRGVANVLKFESTIAKLAVTTDLTAEQGALAFAQIANVLQLPQDQIDRLGATVVGLGNSFATVESRIVEFTTRIAGAGKIAGLTAGDVAGIGTAFASLGVGAEAGGTAVQKVLLAMVSASEQGGEELDTFAATAGVTATEFARLFREDAAQAFTAFVEGLGRQGTSAIATLESLGLQDQRLIRSFLAAAGAGDTLARAVAQGNQEFEANTALTEEAAKRFKTFESQLTLTWNRLKDLAITIGDQLLPVVAQLAEKVNGLLKATDGLNSSTVQWGIALGVVTATIGPLLLVMGKLLRMAVLLKPAIIGLAATLGVSTGGLALIIGGAVTALGFLATAFVKSKIEAAALGEEVKGINAQLRDFAQTVQGMNLDAAAKSLSEMVDERDRLVLSIDIKKALGDPVKDILPLEMALAQLDKKIRAVQARIVELQGVGGAAPPTVPEPAGTGTGGPAGVRALRLPDLSAPKFTPVDIQSFEEMARGLKKVTEEATKLQVVSGHIVFAFSNSLVSALTSGKDAFKSFVDTAIQQLLRLTAQLAVFGLVSRIFPGSGIAASLGSALGFSAVSSTGSSSPAASFNPPPHGVRASGGGASFVVNVPPARDPISFARDADWQRAWRETAREAAAAGFSIAVP